MGKRCCVKNCINHKSKHPQFGIFKVPDNDELFKKWSIVLSSYDNIFLSKKNYVCEKHFKKEHIKDETLLTDPSGKVIFQRKLLSKRLLPGAVPVFFGSKDYSDVLLQSLDSENLVASSSYTSIQASNLYDKNNIAFEDIKVNSDLKIKNEDQDEISDDENINNKQKIKHEIESIYIKEENYIINNEMIYENYLNDNELIMKSDDKQIIENVQIKMENLHSELIIKHENDSNNDKIYNENTNRQFCNKNFNQIEVLNKHEEIHTGAKPFPCDFCDKISSDEVLMNRLMKS